MELTITTVGSRGDGIAETEKGPVYVPFTAPGDVIEAEVVAGKKGPVSARMLRLLQAGEDRTDPPCRHFRDCGGCTLQHLSGNAYRGWLKDRVHTALAHQGFNGVNIADPFVSPAQSRRRLALKALRLSKRIILGFSAQGSHQIVDLLECPVARPVLTGLFDPLRDLLQHLLPEKAGATIIMTDTDTGIDLVFEAAFSLGLKERERLTDFANQHDLAAITWMERGFPEPVVIRRQPLMVFGGVPVPLPPGAFIQATAESEQTMLAIASEAIGDAAMIADLFCGLGTFTLPFAAKAKLSAVEGLKPLLDALRKGVNQTAGKNLKDIRASHRDLFRNPFSASELNDFDAVLFDPPRTGAREQVKELALSAVPVIIGISCNPNTFSRDARALADGGYELTVVHPIGQFLWSHHVELVGVFKK